ncbi:hypothetical protein ZWY2020_017055 [Hordeum vulgare]|nr:hypothetical protein ZWY2020_017055 [Hordeum vulgare]
MEARGSYRDLVGEVGEVVEATGLAVAAAARVPASATAALEEVADEYGQVHVALVAPVLARTPGHVPPPLVRSHRSPTAIGDPPLDETLAMDGGAHLRCAASTTAPGGDSALNSLATSIILPRWQCRR